MFSSFLFIHSTPFASKPKFATCVYEPDMIGVDAIHVKEVSIDLFHCAVLATPFAIPSLSS